MYKFYNPNPSNNFRDDCVVRAIMKLENKSWDDVYLNMCLYGFIEKEMPSVNRVWKKYLIKLGYKRYVLPNTCPDCYTVQDFCREYPHGKYILVTDGHVVAVVDGDYYDAFDSGDEMPIYYWHKED